MRNPINKQNSQNRQKQNIFLNSDVILRFLINSDDNIDTLILCKNTEYNLHTTDANVYEALASIQQYDNVKLNKLTKFFEVVNIASFKQNYGKDKRIATHQRVEELRKLALLALKQ